MLLTALTLVAVAADLEQKLEESREMLEIEARPYPPDDEGLRSLVEIWVEQRALHQRYRGAIIYQQVGLEAYGAYAPFLEEEERAGRFRVLDPKLREALYAWLRRDA